MKKNLSYLFLIVCFLFVNSPGHTQTQKPVIYLIGDSTVKNGSGRGEGGLWGWGDFLYRKFDTTQVHILNKALGGRSSRTFISEGLWEKVKLKLKPGDYVMIQFGHNDSGNINDNHRARGTIKGNGDDSVEIDNILTGRHEVVHSYGWYIRKYIRESKARGATPVVCSMVARNIWEEKRVVRVTDNYTRWAMEAASSLNAYFIDLNDLVATRYESLGQDYVTNKLFLEDHTHTNEEGANINVQCVVEGIKQANIQPLINFMKD